MNWDGVNEIPEESKLDCADSYETITPERCKEIDDFEEAMDERTEQLNSEIESSPEANDFVDKLADIYSVDDILSMKENSKDPNEMRKIFQDACLGNHPDMSDEDRAEMIENAKGNWENCQIENHMYDMALDRLGYDSENELNRMGNSVGETPTEPETSEVKDDPLPVSDGEENNSLRTVGVAVAMGAAFISGINPENIGQPEKTAELFGRYMVQVENEKKKSAGMDQAGQQDYSGEPPDPVNSLNLELGKKGVVVTFPNVSEIKDFDTPQKMDEKILDESSDFKNPAIEGIVKNANFSTSPFRKFEADHGIEKQEDSATIEEIKNVISEKAENCIEKLASTAPFSTEFLNEQRMKLKEHADTVADSGDNFKNREVHQGDVFVRICAGSDRGISPFFTTEDEIAKVSFKSDDGILHINEPKFRDKFALPENSRLEQCQVFKAKEDFNAYVSEIAPSTELWGVVKHSGGAEQTIILDREKLSFVETVAVINDTEEEFSHIEAKNNQSKG